MRKIQTSFSCTIEHYLLIPFFFLCIPLFFITPAHAGSCSRTTAASSISVPNLIVQRDAAVGSQIGSEVMSGSVNFYSCQNAFLDTYGISWGVKSYGTYVTTINGRRVYSTNIPGIGYAIGITSTNSCIGNNAYVDGAETLDGNANNRIICVSNLGFNGSATPAGRFKLTFYKTAAVTGSGIVENMNAGSMIINYMNSWQPDSVLTMNSFTVSTTACSVTNTAIKVPMGNVLKAAFSGQGSTTPEKGFSINLDCDAATRVNLTLDDPTGKSSQPGVLPLTTATEGTTAGGVGIQVLYNDAPVTFGSMFNIATTTTKGAMTIPLKARYYQTAGTVTAGKANSMATFTLTYQ
ncbi:fimbrial protein [Serratia proteamaculans]|uniref:Fimbrial protein n=1 Tax=Serratia proteamaculans TaxID=28151 RepID=A0A5Q2V6Z4_SERPR|nr:fimbrial protein [Serratia proteamaculans]QGH59850.1 fimbrial protein [Serratia proteamaculans]